uniref:Tail protein n=1 Tax=viral metagenome TaxID=1070528 RepID=A0A6M3KQP4_9ZZZZ
MIKFTVTVTPSFKKLAKKYGAMKIRPYLEELMLDCAQYLREALRQAYLRRFEPYTGALFSSIGYRRRGTSFNVGIFPRAGATSTEQAVSSYAPSVVFGWEGVALPKGVIINRLAAYIQARTGQPRAVAVRMAYAMARNMQRPHEGKNFFKDVVNLPARGGPEILKGLHRTNVEAKYRAMARRIERELKF